MDALEMGRWLTATGFASLAVVSLLAYRARRTPATGWLASGAGALGLGPVLEVLARSGPAPASSLGVALLDAVVATAFSVFPVVLARFGRTLGAPRGIAIATYGAAAATVIAALVPGVPQGPAFAVAWLLAGTSVSWQLHRLARARADTAVARRVRVGAYALAAVVLVPLAANILLGALPTWAVPIELAGKAIGLAAAAAIVTGIVSPSWLRPPSLREQEQRVRDLGGALASAEDPTPVVAEVVAAAPSILGGVAAWLTDGREVRHVRGLPDEVALAISASLPVTSTEHRLTWRDDHGTHVAAPAGEGWLVVCLGEMIAVQSDAELRLLDRLAVTAGFAVERARSHERHRESIERLQAASALKDDFLATISHELRTPLTAIRGFAELLRTHERTLAPADREGLLERVIVNASDLENLIAGLMDLTTLRERQGARRIGRYDLRDVCDRVIARQRHDLDDHEVVFDVESGDLVTDGVALGDALAQLLTNAVKFSAPGTRISVSGRISSGDVRIAVSDEGVGIAEHEHDAVFEPFYRTGDVLTRATRGAGIGLTVVRELAERLGGQVSVTSAPEQGATFVLVISRVHPEADPQDLPPEARRWAVRSRRPTAASATDRADLADAIRGALDETVHA